MTHNITGPARKAYARQICRRLNAGMTRVAVSIELGITTYQLDGIVVQYPCLPQVQRVARAAMTAECPVCDVETQLAGGRIEPHGDAVCAGTGTWLDTINEGEA